MKKYLAYFLIFLFIAQSGIPFFQGDFWLIITSFLIVFLFIFNKYRLSKHIFYYTMFFAILMLSQFAITGNFLLGPFLGYLLRIITAYMFIKLIGLNFNKKFINLMYVLSCLSLIIWSLVIIFPSFYYVLQNIHELMIYPLESMHVRQNIIFYTNDYWMQSSPPRNAGPFWEPGAFGVFLILAILLEILKTQKIITKKNIVFFVSLITTFSLGTFVSVAVLLLLYFIFFMPSKINKLILVPLLLFTLLIIYNKSDFLSGKMEYRNIRMMNFYNENYTYNTLDHIVGRNEQAILDLREFIKHPLIGIGQFTQIEFGSSASGITDYLKKWGILGFGFFFINMYYSFKSYVVANQLNRKYAIFATLIMITISLTQNLYGKPLFIMFSFMYLVFNKNEIKNVD